ncbi:MAG: ABC transporter permease [Candidatus Omnitrophica bacterium]|nr:ABC transporter permease [Candidatus Omnitrophota bacterium]
MRPETPAADKSGACLSAAEPANSKCVSLSSVRYEPNRIARLGLGAWPLMCRELWGARELAARLFLRNLKARYKQALLGFFWALLVPLLAVGTFVLLNRAGVLVIGPTDVPYPLFALAGLTVFQLFSTGLVSSCSALVEAGDMIARVNFPREVLVLAAIGQAVFELLVKTALIAAACVYYGFLPPAGALLVPFTLVPLILLTLGLGLFLSLANAVFRDTAQAVGVLLTFLMFLTPVLYPADGAREWLFRLNPLTALVEASRDLFIYGALRHPLDFGLASAGSLLVFLCAWRIFHLVSTKVPERI